MTIEELMAEVAKLTAANEAVVAKNKELLGEVKVLKVKARGSDIDPIEHAALQTAVDELTEKLSTATKTGKVELDRLQKTVTEKEGALNGLLIGNGISEALAKAGVNPDYVDALSALFKSQSAVTKTDKGYTAQIGDKPLKDAIGEYLSGEKGKSYLAAPNSSGGGAAGGGKPLVKKFAEMSGRERTELIRKDPQAYEAAKKAG